MFINEKDVKPNQYKYLCSSGMWDVLHAGHKYTLKKQFEFGQIITIGLVDIPGRLAVCSKLKEYISPAKERMKELEKYIKQEIKPTKPYEIKYFKTDTEAQDYFTQARKNGKMDAFIFSEKDKTHVCIKGVLDTVLGIFKGQGFTFCDIILTEIQKNEKGLIISSSAIRSKKYIKEQCPNLYRERKQ